jgi:hypothetical protein
MLLFNNDPIARHPAQRKSDYDQRFQPGDLYLTKYMSLPYIATVTDCTDTTVSTVLGTEDIQLFNLRAVCYLGRRARFLGFWLPWAWLRPTRSVDGNDKRFWSITVEDMRGLGLDPDQPLQRSH